MAEIQKFVSVNGTKKEDYDKIDEWFRLCKTKQIPYIVIKNKKKYARIEWDYISYVPEVDIILDDLRDTTISYFDSLYMTYGVKKSAYDIGGRLAVFKDMPIETAETVAQHLYDYIHSMVSGKASKSSNS